MVKDNKNNKNTNTLKLKTSDNSLGEVNHPIKIVKFKSEVNWRWKYFLRSGPELVETSTTHLQWIRCKATLKVVQDYT